MKFDKSKMFIKCDCCGKKIKYGATAYVVDGLCGIYHSMTCGSEYFGRQYLEDTLVDADLITNCRATVYTTQFSKNKNDKPVELNVEPFYENRQVKMTKYNGVVEEAIRPLRVGWKWSIKA